MRSRVWRWFALILPLVVLVVGVVRGERALRVGETWWFDITGYDPQDLLRGRYLRFQVEEQWGEPYDATDDDADCACLERTTVQAAPVLRAASCSFARASCDRFIVRTELDQLDRFYVPEARARELEAWLQDAASRDAAQIVVAIDRDGSAVIVDLLVDGAPILE